MKSCVILILDLLAPDPLSMEQDVSSVRYSEQMYVRPDSSTYVSTWPPVGNGSFEAETRHFKETIIDDKRSQFPIQGAFYHKQCKAIVDGDESRQGFALPVRDRDSKDLERDFCPVRITVMEDQMHSTEEKVAAVTGMVGLVQSDEDNSLWSTTAGGMEDRVENSEMMRFSDAVNAVACFIDDGCSDSFKQILQLVIDQKQSVLAEAMLHRNDLAFKNAAPPIEYSEYKSSVSSKCSLHDSTHKGDDIFKEKSTQAVLRLKHDLAELADKYGIRYT